MGRHYFEAVTPSSYRARRTIEIGGERIPYTLEAEDRVLPGANGAPAFDSFCWTYLREDIAEPETRPVLFAFNGGPTSNSAWLHMGFYGPRLLTPGTDGMPDPALAGTLRDNPDCLLDICDIVMIDPVNTGFSRLLREECAEEFLGDHSDADRAADFIRLWLKEHHRERAPVFLSGESFGSTRASLLSYRLAEECDLRGIVHIGPGYSCNDDPPRIFKDLPPAAAVKWYYEDEPKEPLADRLAACDAFLYGAYVPAMYRGFGLLTEAERNGIAERLEHLTGLSKEYYLVHELKGSRADFRNMLLADRGLKLGSYDARFTLPLNAEGEPFMSAYTPQVDAAMTAFLAENGIDPGRAYRGSSWEDDPDWDWFYGAARDITGMMSQEMSMSDAVKSAMERKPDLRLFFGTGCYDTVATIENTRFCVLHSGLPMERVTLKNYESGHAVYADEVSRRRLARDVRAFLESCLTEEC